MNSTRMMSLLTTVGVVAALSMAAPALATDYSSPGKPGAAAIGVKAASAPDKRHYGWSRYRIASWYAHYRYANAAPALVQPASWSGRPFVLIVGIGF